MPRKNSSKPASSRKALQQATAAKAKLCEQARAFAAERAGLEKAIESRGQEIARADELRESLENRLAETSREKEVLGQAMKAAETEKEGHKTRIASLEDALKQLEVQLKGQGEGKLEDVPKQCAPRADVETPLQVSTLS